MKNTKPFTSIVVALSLALVGACSSDDKGSSTTGGDGGASSSGGGGDSCANLCTNAKFTGGKATDFGGGVVECVCAGTSATGIAKADCEAYCKPMGVPAAKSFLSKAVAQNDKCVCDGT